MLFGLLIHMIGSGLAHEIDVNLGQFIVDVTTSLYAGSSFTAFLCTNHENSVHFSSQMSKNYVLHEIDKLSGDHQFRHVDSSVAHQNFYVLDLNCQNSDAVLLEANSKGMFIAPTKWLILQDLRLSNEIQSSELNETKLQNLFGDLDIFPDSEINVGRRIEDNRITLLSLYRPSLLHQLVSENRGMWTNAESLQLLNHYVTSRRRTNLQGTALRASSVITNPDSINHMEDFADKRSDAGSKFSFALSKLLVARLNATVNFTFVSAWGAKDENNTWTGMIGEIQRGEADFCASVTFITPSRIGAIDYLQLYWPDSVKFIFKRPPLSHVSNIFTLPFSKNVWIAAIVFCSIGVVAMYLSMKWEWKEVKEIPYDERLPGDMMNNPSAGDNLLITVGAITQQGAYYEPRSVPARIVIFMLLLFCLSLYAAYTANIVALLQSSSDSIKNIEDLMESPLKIGIHDVVYNRLYFGSFEDSLRKEFYERRVKNEENNWLSVEEGVARMRNELFAFIIDLTAGYSVVQSTYGEDEKCGFEEVDYLLLSHPLLCIKHQSPYQEIFRVGAIWIDETGSKDRHSKIMCNKKPICNGQYKFVSVGTIECYAAYFIMACGIAVTFGILLLEVLWSKRSKHMEAENDAEIQDVSSNSISEISEAVED